MPDGRDIQLYAKDNVVDANSLEPDQSRQLRTIVGPTPGPLTLIVGLIAVLHLGVPNHQMPAKVAG